MIIKHPVLIHAGINLHIRDNDQCFRHFLRRNIVIPCCFQNVFKCSLQIRIHSPANTLNTLDFLLQRFPLQGNKFWLLTECHKKIVVSTPVPLCKVNGKANRCRHGSYPHRTGNICNDNRIRFLCHIVRQLAPLCFHYLVPRIEIQYFFYKIVRIQRLRMNLFFSLQCVHQIPVKTLHVMSQECVPVNHHSSSGDLRVYDLLPLSFWHFYFQHADVFPQGTDDSFEVVNRIAELLRRQNAELSRLFPFRICRLDPFGKQGNAFSLPKIFQICFQLLLHGTPHLVLNASSDQAVPVVKTAENTNQVKVGNDCLRMVLGKIL